MPSVEFYPSPAPIGRGTDGVKAVTRQVGVLEESLPVVEWRWRLKADNGEIIASGEAHTRRDDAIRAFRTVSEILLEFNGRRTYMPDEDRDSGTITWTWR